MKKKMVTARMTKQRQKRATDTRMPGRETPEERTLSMNLGLAIEDVATAKVIFQRAQEMVVGQELPL